MSEFSAAAELSLSVPDRELSKARSKVESAIGPVPVRIEADGGVGGPPTGPGGRSMGGRDATKELRDQTELLEAGQQLDYQRNVYLKEILEELANDGAGGGDGGGDGGDLLRLGGGGGLGLLRLLGGLSLGSHLINFLKNFKFKPPSVPNIKVPKPKWTPPRVPKPDWVPLPIEEPAPLPVEDPAPFPVEDPAPFPVEDPGPIPVNAPDYIPLVFPGFNPSGDMYPGEQPSPAPDPRGYGSVTRDRPSPLGDPDEVPAEDPTPSPEIPPNRQPYTPEAPLPTDSYGMRPGVNPMEGPADQPTNENPPGWMPSPEDIILGGAAAGSAAGLKWGTGSGSGAPGVSGGLPISLAPIFAGASNRGPLSDILPGGNETVQRNRGRREMAFQQSQNKAREAGGGSVARVDVRNEVEINDNRDLDRKLEQTKKETKREIERSFSGGRVR